MKRDRAAGAVTRVLGTPLVASVGHALTRSRLRVVAFHQVRHADRFAAQLRTIRRSYQPVSGAQVAAHVLRGEPLPDDAVWLTFDDGSVDVVDLGLPVLASERVPATLFVCPGVIEAGEPYWWEDVSQAEQLGWTWPGVVGASSLVTALKRLPDRERRLARDDAVRFLGVGRSPGAPLTCDLLHRWRDAGLEIGNHTWDHPCLDRCDGPDQIDQVRRADSWLREHGFLVGPGLFAYPNGDWTMTVETELAQLGYGIGLLFDHRLVRSRPHALRLSRLRLDTDASPARTRAVLSGLHSAVYRASAGTAS